MSEFMKRLIAKNTFTSEVKKTEDGELYIEISEDLLNKADLKVGDELIMRKSDPVTISLVKKSENL